MVKCGEALPTLFCSKTKKHSPLYFYYYIQAVERFARHFHHPPDQLNQTLCSPKTPELCSPTFGAVFRELSSWAGRRQLSGVSERSMMIP